jgi:hypothetical protein
VKHISEHFNFVSLHSQKDYELFLKIFSILVAGGIGVSLGWTQNFLFLFGFATLIAFGILMPAIFLYFVLISRPIVDQFVEFKINLSGATSVNLQAVLGFSVVLVSVVYFFVHGKKASWKIGLLVPMILFLGSTMFTIFWSYDFLIGLGDWIRIASWMLLIPFTTSVLSDPIKEDRLIDSCVIAGIICIILLYVGPIEGTYGLGGRKGWFFSLHNAALLMVGISPFILVRFIQTTGKWKLTYGIVCFSLFTSIFFTFVRSAWVASLTQFFSLFIMGRKGRKTVFFLLLALIIPAFFIFIQSQEVEKRMADLIYQDTPFYYRHIGSGRLGFWEDISITFWDSSFIEKIVGNGFRAGIFATEIGVGGHNDFIDLLYNNGLFGLGLMLWLIGGLFKIGKRLSGGFLNGDLARVYWGVFWGFIIVAFVNGIIFYVGTMWYISAFIGLACARLRICNQRDFR